MTENVDHTLPVTFEEAHVPGTDLAVPTAADIVPVQPSAAAEVAMIGSELVLPGEFPQWTMPDRTAVVRPIQGVFLGARPNSSGWGSTYHDEHHTATDAGFNFVVTQSSAGFTGMSATPQEGFTVEALEADKTTGLPIWKGKNDYSDRVSVSSNRGKMGDEDFDWQRSVQEGFGNPGAQVGVVRVTGPDGAVKYYAMGADFRGREDSWTVTGSLVEVVPNDPLVLESVDRNPALVEQAVAEIEAAKPASRGPDDYYIRDYIRVEGDPLYDKRREVRAKADSLVTDLQAALPKMQADGLVVEKVDRWRQQRRVRLFEFAEPMTMPDGRIATMEFEVPDGGEQAPESWGLKLRMAWDSGNRVGNRGYSVADIMVFEPSERSPERHTSASASTGSGGQHTNSSLLQHHSNTMYQDVSTVDRAVSDADTFLRRIIGADESTPAA